MLLFSEYFLRRLLKQFIKEGQMAYILDRAPEISEYYRKKKLAEL